MTNAAWRRIRKVVRLPNWFKTPTRLATDKTVDELVSVRTRLAESINDLEIAITKAAHEDRRKDAD